MITKIYGLIWGLGALSVAVFYFTGNFSPMIATVFGFLSFGAIFIGMLGVLPLTISHHPTEKH